MKDSITKELLKMRKTLKKSEKAEIVPLIETIETMLENNFQVTAQSVYAISGVLHSISSITESVKVYKHIINILMIIIKNIESIKSNNSIVPIKAQLNLDKTMIALDIFIASLINKIGG